MVVFSEQLKIVFSDNFNKHNIEKESEEEQLSTIEFIKLFIYSCYIFNLTCRRSESKLRCATMASSISE
jgi:hypothetical protein